MGYLPHFPISFVDQHVAAADAPSLELCVNDVSIALSFPVSAAASLNRNSHNRVSPTEAGPSSQRLSPPRYSCSASLSSVIDLFRALPGVGPCQLTAPPAAGVIGSPVSGQKGFFPKLSFHPNISPFPLMFCPKPQRGGFGPLPRGFGAFPSLLSFPVPLSIRVVSTRDNRRFLPCQVVACFMGASLSHRVKPFPALRLTSFLFDARSAPHPRYMPAWRVLF